MPRSAEVTPFQRPPAWEYNGEAHQEEECPTEAVTPQQKVGLKYQGSRMARGLLEKQG